MATTPPPLTVTEPPPTPLYGAKYDACAVDSARKTKRQKVAGALARTPSPTGRRRASNSASPSLRRSARLRSSAHSPPSSPLSPSRPQRPRAKHTGAKGIEASEKQDKSQPSEDFLSASSLNNSHMLPTPTKTPRKKDTKKSPSVTRILFPHGPQPVEEAMPKSHKKGGRSKALSLESFKSNGGAGAEIDIFTDTRDTIPEVDTSADNPFYSFEESVPQSKKKASGKAKGPEEKLKNVVEADEGMVYVFRGQRRYKHFREIDEETPEEGGDAAANGLSLEHYPDAPRFTRSSVKPRVLFPRAEAAIGTTTDEEEAPTDIDDAEATTPTKAKAPDATIGGAEPITPPTTARAKKRVISYDLEQPDAEVTDVADDKLFTVKKARRDGKAEPTPFASWKRTKSSSGMSRGAVEGKATAGKSKKRAAEEPEYGEESKRLKTTASTSV